MILNKMLEERNQPNQSELSAYNKGLDIIDFVWEKHVELLVPYLPNICIVRDILRQVFGWQAVGGKRMRLICKRDMFRKFLDLFTKCLENKIVVFCGYTVGRQRRGLGCGVWHVGWGRRRVWSWRSLHGRIVRDRLG